MAFVAMAAPAAAATPFSTFLAENAFVQGLGHDSGGNIFVAGLVAPSPLPGRTSDIFIARLNPNATRISWFLYLPAGSGVSRFGALAVDPQGNSYVAGCTMSADFPATSGGPPPSGVCFPFTIKLNPNGTVVYAAVFAAVSAAPAAIVADAASNVIVSGTATSGYAATPGAISLATSDDQTFVTKLDPSGSKILFTATGVGGSQLALGPQGDLFIAGNTTSTSYPATPGALQSSFKPGISCGPEGICKPAQQQYVTRLSADGAKLIYSTFLTGLAGAVNSGLAVDAAGNAYVTGVSPSPDYPFTGASPDDRLGVFLSKLDPTGTKLVWSVRQGGSLLALDAAGNPVAGATTAASDLPVLPTACLPNGSTIQSIAWLQQFNAADGRIAATRVQTGSNVTAAAIGVEPDGRVLLAGQSSFPDIPLSPGVAFSDAAAQRMAHGAFLAAFDLGQASPQLGCVLDSAAMVPVGPVAPGQFISLFGSSLDSAPVQVSFDSFAAPLLYVSSGQINAQVPFAIALRPSTVMTVSIGSNLAATRMFAGTLINPSVFVDGPVFPRTACAALPDGAPAYHAVALNADGSRNACDNPATPASTIAVFLNGVPPPQAARVAVRSGAISLAAGPLTPLSSEISGVYQLPIQLPGSATSGLRALGLGVDVNGVPAAPFGPTPDASIVVWIKE